MNTLIKIPLIVCLALMLSKNSLATALPESDINTENKIRIESRLSQSKLVQHGSNTVFLDISFNPPAIGRLQPKRATDMIIVLDRSGSMSEARKMPFAKAAIRDVLGRLSEHDRFALVSFADHAIVHSPLVSIHHANRDYLFDVVNHIRASGNTNMGDGLNNALKLLAHNDGHRARKVLLLSDGQANQGITDPKRLSRIASRLTDHGAVLSTIGMGLSFNENLMAQLADYGMGHYSYLEDLSGLGQILAKDLQDSRQIYANSSTLDIELGAGVSLNDAGGYPISRIDGSTLRITTGQMLANTRKHFIISFNVPTSQTGNISLGRLKLNYRVDKQTLQSDIGAESLQVTIVAPEMKEQARLSIDRKVYEDSWVNNNLARMKKKLGTWLQQGKKDQAEKAIKEYRQEIEAASSLSQLPLASPKVEKKLAEMEQQVDEAFAGSMLDQQLKRNRAAKSMQYESIKMQRK